MVNTVTKYKYGNLYVIYINKLCALETNYETYKNLHIACALNINTAFMHNIVKPCSLGTLQQRLHFQTHFTSLTQKKKGSETNTTLKISNFTMDRARRRRAIVLYSGSYAHY